MKVCCIVPVYNVSKYIDKCIKSILAQTYKNIDIILINDASKDNSDVICARFQSIYPNKIHYINKSINEGVDRARFTGLEYVLANYAYAGVMFIDSDDYIEKESVELLVKAMERDDSDVVQMRANRFLGFIKRPHFSPMIPQTIEQPELFENYFISFFGVNILDVWMCSKLYRLETIRKANLSPSGFKMGEDLMFNLKLFPFYKRYTIIDYRGYNYRVGGLTSRYNPTMWNDLKEQYRIKRHEAETHNYSKAYRTLAIELKNIFKAEITQRIFYLQDNDSDLIKWIETEIKEDIWHDLRNELSDYTDTTTQFIIRKNAKGILNDVRESMKHNRKRFLIKRILMKLFK